MGYVGNKIDLGLFENESIPANRWPFAIGPTIKFWGYTKISVKLNGARKSQTSFAIDLVKDVNEHSNHTGAPLPCLITVPGSCPQVPTCFRQLEIDENAVGDPRARLGTFFDFGGCSISGSA